MFRHRPHPTDPNKSSFDIFFLAHLPEGQNPPLPPKTVVKAADADLGLVLNQDKENLWSVQAGMSSGALDWLHLGSQEVRVRHFHKVIDQYMRAGESA
jgi:hypothetical protein